MLYTFCLALFLIIVGFLTLPVATPQWLRWIGGGAGIIAGIVLLIGLF